MRNKIIIMGIIPMIFLMGCNQVSEQQASPLRGIAWFTDMETVKNALSDMELLQERESGEGEQKQYLLDYSGAVLFETDCDLTVCCTNQGFAGLNYHDIEKKQTYRQWMTKLEDIYGLPTEKGSGMASWYQNPVGKDTAMYLFNLEEGIQISFYAVSASPDKSYDNHEERTQQAVFVPTPELRTPVIPAEDTPLMEDDIPNFITTETTDQTLSQSGGLQENENIPVESVTMENPNGENEEISENEQSETENELSENDPIPENETRSTAVTTSKNSRQNVTTTTATVVTTAKQEEPEEEKKTEAVIPKTAPPVEETVHPAQSFLLNGLQFYGGIDTERRKMQTYTQLYEYQTDEPNQPWQLIMEYENVPYLNKKCDAVLCFTSLGLVGINYFDSNSGNYAFWVNSMTEIYGSPDDSESDYTAWTANPVGNGTAIYVFALEDGIQVSFFADDTGSALS